MSFKYLLFYTFNILLGARLAHAARLTPNNPPLYLATVEHREHRGHAGVLVFTLTRHKTRL